MLCVRLPFRNTVAWTLDSLELSPLLLVCGSAFNTGRHGRVRWLRCDATLVDTRLNEHVTIHAPALAPAVLDLPIVTSTRSSKSNCQDTVIQVGTAAAGRHTRAVHLEGELVCLNCNRDGAGVGDGIQKGRLAADILVSSHTTARDGSRVAALATAIGGFVWVR